MVVASGEVRLPRVRRREAGAEIDRLYRKHADEVFRYALMVTRSRPDAEDITQIVFVRALRAIERGEKVRTPRNWLIKIAHNECRRLLSSRKVHAELPDEIAVEPAERTDVTELRRAMEGLPEAQRKALCLRELEGRTYVEIATELELTVSAVETLIFRARRTLREQLEASMSCEDFAQLLDDPSARSRIRAHARVCPECATLERQARGRKSALKRIASMLGLPMWGTKLAAVGLTAAAVAASAASVHAINTRHHHRTPAVPHKVAPHPAVAKRVSDTRKVSGTSSAAVARVAPKAHRGSAPPRVMPHANPSAPAPSPTPLPQPDPPAPSLPPAAETPAAAPAASAPSAPAPAAEKNVAAPITPPTVSTPAVSVTPPPIETPPVTVPSVTTPVVTTPAVTVPSVTVSVPVPTVPTVTTPVPPPNVSLP